MGLLTKLKKSASYELSERVELKMLLRDEGLKMVSGDVQVLATVRTIRIDRESSCFELIVIKYIIELVVVGY